MIRAPTFSEVVSQAFMGLVRKEAALAAAARQGGDVKQAPGEAPQSGGAAVTPNPSPSHIPLMNKEER